MFGSKSKREGILYALKSLCDHPEEILEDDGQPQFICKPCVTKIANYKELQCVARATESANREAEMKCKRFKRGRKQEESPQPRSGKCGTPKHARKKTKSDTCGVQVYFSPRVILAPKFSLGKENNTRQRQPIKFAPIFPKPSLPTMPHNNGVEAPSSKPQRVLPDYLQPKEKQSHGVEILQRAGLHKLNHEVRINFLFLWLMQFLFKAHFYSHSPTSLT